MGSNLASCHCAVLKGQMPVSAVCHLRLASQHNPLVLSKSDLQSRLALQCSLDIRQNTHQRN